MPSRSTNWFLKNLTIACDVVNQIELIDHSSLVGILNRSRRGADIVDPFHHRRGVGDAIFAGSAVKATIGDPIGIAFRKCGPGPGLPCDRHLVAAPDCQTPVGHLPKGPVCCQGLSVRP